MQFFFYIQYIVIFVRTGLVVFVKLFCIALNSECWTPTNDVHGFGGTAHSSTTLIHCKAACVDDNKCVAIDWQPTNAPNACWILTSTVTGDTTQTGVITHYELNRACPSEFQFTTQNRVLRKN